LKLKKERFLTRSFFYTTFESLDKFLYISILQKEQLMPINITRIFDFPYYQLETYNLNKAFTTKYDGEWKSISTQEYINQANAISRGLLRLGVKKNDKIAVISSTNRTEWNIVDIE
jgi:long-chain acyl-CoA synthetase